MPSNATPTESIVTVSGAELSEAATGILEQFPDGLDGDLPSAEEVASRLDQMTNQYRVPLDEARRAAVSHYRDVLGLEYDDLEFPGQTAADVALSSVNQDEQQVDVTVKVVELWEPTHDSIDQVGLIGDESGRLKFTKWAKAELPAVEEGSVYKFSNVVTSAYEGRYSINLNLSREVRQRALKLAREASEVGLGNGCRPTGVAAACVYEAGREADEKVTQARLAELASVSDITLREQWKKLQSMLERPEQSGLEVHG